MVRLGDRQVRGRRRGAPLRRVLGSGVVGWGGNARSRVMADNVSMEICQINTRTATTANCITGTSNVRDVAVLVIDIEIGGTGGRAVV